MHGLEFMDDVTQEAGIVGSRSTQGMDEDINI